MSKLLLSPYAINLYRTCPYKYYLEYHTNVPKLPSFFEYELRIGYYVHQIIKTYYEIIPNSITPGEVQLYVARAFKEVGLEDDRLMRSLKGFIRFEKQRLSWHINPKPIAIEKEYIKKPLHGIVDAVFRKGKKVIVVDWKTGWKQSSDTLSEDLAIQGMTYKYLTEADEVWFIFLRFNTYTKMPNYSMDWFFNIVKEVYNGIVNNKFPKKRVNCDLCEYNIYCWLEDRRLTIWDL